MFDSLKNLTRRRGRLDKASQAYIEGRAEAASAALVRQRLAASPEEREDIESLRDTVSLLRSVAPVKAPRSFALHEALAQRPAARRTAWHLQAPAMAAAVAVMVIGVFIAGDLTGALKQSGGRGPSSSTSIESLAAQSVPGPTGAAGQTESLDAQQTQASLAGASLPAAATPGAGAAPSPEPSAAKTLAPQASGATVAGSSDQPPASGQDTSSLAESTSLVAATAAPESAAPVSTTGAFAQTAQDGATVLGVPGPSPVPVLGLGDLDEGGLSLPLWQIEVALAGVATALLAAWAWLRRRRSA